jgi:hypothetical protein
VKLSAFVQKPEILTTFGRFNYSHHKKFNNKHLISAKDGQFTTANDDQSHWLSQAGLRAQGSGLRAQGSGRRENFLHFSFFSQTF